VSLWPSPNITQLGKVLARAISAIETYNDPWRCVHLTMTINRCPCVLPSGS